MKYRVLLPPLALFSLFSTCAGAQTDIVSPAFSAHFDANGSLQSLKIQGQEELLRAPLELGAGLKWTLDKVEGTGAQRKFLLKSDHGTAEMLGEATPTRFTLTLTQKTGALSNWQAPFSDALAAVENLQDCTPTGAEAIRYREHGEIYAVPISRLSRVQRCRLYLRSGRTLLFWHDGWGAPFNLDEMGGWNGTVYRRGILENNKPMRVVWELEPEKANDKAAPKPGAESGPIQPAPVFVPYGATTGNLTLAGEPVRFTLKFADPTLDRLKAAPNWRVEWRVRDFREREVQTGSAPFPAAMLIQAKSAEVAFPMKQRGWFSVVFALSPEGAVTPRMAPSEYRSRFAVVDKTAALPDLRPASEKLSEYGYMALIGVRGMRESHNMRDFFPEKGKANWQALDKIMDEASAQAKQWGTTWFFQANSRPAWCNEADYEQIAFDMVSRYKDRCKTWEVENEPNFSYSPDDYVKKALIPFAQGAKRADPTCQILGPACVSVPNTLRFMQAIIAQGALKYLDGVSTHTYVGPGEPWELFGNPEYLTRLRQISGSLPFWQTEQGYTWSHTSRDEQARYVVRQYLNGWGSGIPGDHQYYFYPVHNGFEPWYLVEMGSTEGLNGTYEPAGIALRVLNAQIAGRQAGTQTTLFPGVQYLRFSGPQEDVIAMWTLDFPISVTLQGPLEEAVDWMGNTIPLAGSGLGGKTAPLDGDPLYLHVPHGGSLRLLWPQLGANLASADQEAKASASSASKEHPAKDAIDGRWKLRDATPGLSERTWWEADTEGASVEKPVWLQVDWPQEQFLGSSLLLCPLPAVDGGVPRDFAIQVSMDGQTWKTVTEVKDWAGWADLRTFEPVRAKHARLLITRLNDGWHLEGAWMFMVGPDFTRYTSMKARVLDWMLFGP